MPFYAHTVPGINARDAWQLLKEHLHATASQAAVFGEAFTSAEWAFLCGLVHDLGKYSQAFQKRLERGPAQGGARVDHSLAGALEAQNLLNNAFNCVLPGNLLAHVVSGHHTGLVDGGVLKNRQQSGRTLPPYSDWQREIDLPAPPAPPPFFTGLHEDDPAFSLCFWARMLFSCLVDADFLDTEKAMAPERAAQRGGYPPLHELLPPLDAALAGLATRTGALDDAPSQVNAHRANVLAACRTASAMPAGLFSLTVPTGGGKTLSSLAFALNHAAAQGMQRVIYVIPYTSIIEQTADVFRRVLGADLGRAVLEHHSGVNENAPDEPGEADARDDARTMAYENWDAPLVVTTSVQFFESLFANRSSRCRKLHNIAGSVVILDEAQTLPVPLLRPCLAALTELTKRYRCSVMLCTATQPEVGKKQ